MMISIETKQIYSGITPIRNSITWANNKKIFAFATLNDICFAKAECLENYASETIIKTLPMKNKAACLAFAKKSQNSGVESGKNDSEVLLVIDSEGKLFIFDVVVAQDDDGKFNIIISETIGNGEKSDYPSDFCQGHICGENQDVISFWGRRNLIFSQKRQSESENENNSSSHQQQQQLNQYKLKSDVKCFDSNIYENSNSIFCAAGCVNGNVYFFETKLNDLSYFAMVGLVTPFPIPVLNIALQQINDMFICTFNHATKVTVVRWEQVPKNPATSSINNENGFLKIRRELQFANKMWYMSTDSVISDFTMDISTLKFDNSGKRLLIVTNDRDFGIYEFRKEDSSDSENQKETYNWLNLIRGGEAKERTFNYCGGCFTTNGNRVLIYTTKGGFMLFNLIQQSEDFYLAIEAPPPITGHTSAIAGAEWDPSGKLLFTAGTISREIHVIACLKDGSFAQVARPESHQYDISCLTSLSGLTIAVGSDELPFRIYKASANYCTSIENLTGIKCESLKTQETQLPTTPFFKQAVLGVLNIAADDSEENDNDPLVDSEAIFEKRPTTNQLFRFTYWEVAESLYGHSNPASTIATDAKNEWIATSCQATSLEDAVIFVRKVNDWNIKNRLVAHQLTVTKLAFSPDSKYLLSVSRDRSFSIFGINNENENNWELKIRVPEAHPRMILACAWIPDSKYFITGSRDSQLCIWPLNAEKVEDKLIMEKLGSPIMAIDVSKGAIAENEWLVAIGLGNGQIQLYNLSFSSSKNSPKLQLIQTLKDNEAFSLAITTLKFRLVSGEWNNNNQEINNEDEKNKFNLVAGSESGIIKVYSIEL